LSSAGPPWELEPDAEELRRLIDRSADFVIEETSDPGSLPASDFDGVADLAATFAGPAPENGGDLGSLLERLRPAVRKSFNTIGPGYMAYVPGGGIPSAALADFIAAAVNRYVGVSAAAPALAQIERTVIGWLAAMMGYPANAGGILTSGGSFSNLVATVTARAAKLPAGLADGTYYVSEEAHLSVLKAARIAGLPEGNLRRVAVDRRLRMDPGQLEEAIRRDRAAGRRPFLVVVNAGTTNTGAVDPVPAVLEIAQRHGLWVHADAAYGGFFRIVPEGPDLLPGLEGCDSITLDPHKGLFLPYGTGCLLVRDVAALLRAHQGEAAYLQDVATRGTEPPNFTDISPELSRDFRGLRIWLPVMLHGLGAFREQLAEKLALARWAHDELRKEPSLEMLDEPQLSVVAFRCRPPSGDPDHAGQELLRRVNARRRVYLSSTRVAGRYVLRICVLAFRTHREHVRDAVTAIREEARSL